jgi:hypothetical protein
MGAFEKMQQWLTYQLGSAHGRQLPNVDICTVLLERTVVVYFMEQLKRVTENIYASMTSCPAECKYSFIEPDVQKRGTDVSVPALDRGTAEG